MSYFLRHHPEKINLHLDKNGFTTITLEEFANRLGVSKQKILKIVEEDPKQRFSIRDNKIRANYGHSIDIGAIIYENVDPIPHSSTPNFLYHGTKLSLISKIMKEGLTPQKRKFVHLSYSIEWAKKVANRRRGETSIIKVDCLKLKELGLNLYDAGPTTVLVNHVPSSCLSSVNTDE